MTNHNAGHRIAACAAMVLLLGMQTAFAADQVNISGGRASSTTSTSTADQTGTSSTGSCKLEEIPETFQGFYDNLQALTDEVKSIGGQSSCAAPSGSRSWVGRAVASINMKSTLDRMTLRSVDLGKVYNAIRFYIRSDGNAVPDYLFTHQDFLGEMHTMVLEAGVEVGNNCGNSNQLTTTVSLEDASYDTNGKRTQEVLNDMAWQVATAMEFIRNLALGHESEIQSERLLSIAPVGFDEEMRALYTPENIAACEAQQPETQAIQETLQQTATTGWQYNEAFQVWRDAFDQLIYRGSSAMSSASSTQTQADQIAARHSGGISQSGKLQNDEDRKGFGETSNDKTDTEHIATVTDQAALSGQYPRADRNTFIVRELMRLLQGGDEFAQPDVDQASFGNTTGGSGQFDSSTNLNPSQFPDMDYESLGVSNLMRTLNADYRLISGLKQVPEASEGAFHVAHLVQAMNTLAKLTELSEQNMNKVCDIFPRQASNVDPSTCQQIRDNIFSELSDS